MSIENIAQKSAADFMQIDEADILIYIVYNKLDNDNAAMRLYKPRSAVFISRRENIRQRKVFSYTLFIQFDCSLF